MKPPVPLIDVRTPAEFEQGHIPLAFNIPLFSNEERVVVGTTYKQVGREAAILLGFDLVGAKWSGFIRHALEMAPQKKVAVHCWRGGMRSGAMAWALNLYGFEVYQIESGYKSYRKWALHQFSLPYQLKVLGGMTGAGKTKMLHALRDRGEQVIDLEHLAQHQGSAYGSMNKLVQPTQEQFENNFAFELNQLHHHKTIWVEDESITIGKRVVPRDFWMQMGEATLVQMNASREQRITSLAHEYGKLDKDFLVACTERIHKRLGPVQYKEAVAAIRDDRMEAFVSIVLTYYDKAYSGNLSRRKSKITTVNITGSNYSEHAQQLIAAI